MVGKLTNFEKSLNYFVSYYFTPEILTWQESYMLSYLIHWSKFFEKARALTEDGYFYFTVKRVELQLKMTRKAQQAYLLRLQELKLIDVRYDNLPELNLYNVRFIKLNWDNIDALSNALTPEQYATSCCDEYDLAVQKIMQEREQNTKEGQVKIGPTVGQNLTYPTSKSDPLINNNIISKTIPISKDISIVLGDSSKNLPKNEVNLEELRDNKATRVRTRVGSAEQCKASILSNATQRKTKRSDAKQAKEDACVNSELRYIVETYQITKNLDIVERWLRTIYQKQVFGVACPKFLAVMERFDEFYKKYTWEQMLELINTCTINSWTDLRWAEDKYKANTKNSYDAHRHSMRNNESVEEYKERKVAETLECKNEQRRLLNSGRARV